MLDDWARRNGRASLGHMFSLLDKTVNKVDVDSVTRISEYWKGNGEKEIDRIDRENRSWKPTKKIKGPARLNLRTKVHQALGSLRSLASPYKGASGEEGAVPNGTG